MGVSGIKYELIGVKQFNESYWTLHELESIRLNEYQ